MSNTALLPCPFCDSSHARVYPRTCNKNTPYNPRDRAFPKVRCGSCGAQSEGEDWTGPETAIDKWNRRPNRPDPRWPTVGLLSSDAAKSDRLLLEQVAKAASLWDYANDCVDIPWNPLSSNSECLELAVRWNVLRCHMDLFHEFYDEEINGGRGPGEATRRAFVRSVVTLSVEGDHI